MTALYDGYGNLILAKTPPQPDLALVAEMLREPERFTEGAREEQARLCEQADNAAAAGVRTVSRSQLRRVALEKGEAAPRFDGANGDWPDAGAVDRAAAALYGLGNNATPFDQTMPAIQETMRVLARTVLDAAATRQEMS